MNQSELKALLKKMSLKEKVNQLSQITSDFFQEGYTPTGPLQDYQFNPDDVGLSGSVIGAIGAEKIIEIQKDYLEKHPHKIPLLFMLDIINGFKTIFPIPLAQGASFNPELSKRIAAIAAKEAAVSGIHVTFAPMVDLVRDPRWGRVMETTGEDPYLNSLFSRAMVEGFQGKKVSEPDKVAACIKHFAGYGAPTGGRDYNTVELSENTLRQYYLPAYQAGIDAGSELVMTSFNTINGVPATGNAWLMNQVLRDEMGFEGVLISDWAAIEELIHHGYMKDKRAAASSAIKANVDIDMMTGIYADNLAQLVNSGELSEEALDASVLRVLTLKNKLGLFDNPFKDANPEREKKIILCDQHRKVAYEAACHSFVLLKNEELLPLKAEEKISFIGPYTKNRDILGSWSFFGSPENAVSIEMAAREKLKPHLIDFSEGSAFFEELNGLVGFGEDFKNEILNEQQAEELLNQAKRIAEKSDKIVMAIGEHKLESGEATSKSEITIPSSQLKLLKEIYKINPNIAVVLFNGRPLDLHEVLPYTKAILEVWLPGTEGGNAIVDTLYGIHNPSGKLPMSFPYNVGQIPVMYNEYKTGRPNLENNKDRFRSKYLDISNKPLYSFGYGLSYSEFEISKPQLNKNIMLEEDELIVTVTIKNKSNTPGTETLQLYIQDEVGSVVRPVKELKGIKKVSLAANEETKVSFKIDSEMLKFIQANNKFDHEEGYFRVYLGSSSLVEEYKRFYFKKL